jgi:hypothetical protein
VVTFTLQFLFLLLRMSFINCLSNALAQLSIFVKRVYLESPIIQVITNSRRLEKFSSPHLMGLTYLII